MAQRSNTITQMKYKDDELVHSTASTSHIIGHESKKIKVAITCNSHDIFHH